jgi:hypothetical protein
LTWLHHNNLQQFLGNITSIKVHKQFMQNLLSKLFLLHIILSWSQPTHCLHSLC